MSHLRHGRPHRIHGWALFRARGAHLAQRRYLRLIHYTLTVFDAADEHSDLQLFEDVLVGADVTWQSRRREIFIRFPSDRVFVQLRTDKEFEAWRTGFVDAARVAMSYYKLVPSRRLGSGAFSTVFFGFDRDDGHHVAIKVVDKTRCSRAELAYAETEARMMAFVRHGTIVQCRDIFDAPDKMYVVMEYMSGGTLEHRLNSMPVAARQLSEKTTATIMSLLLDALAYLEAEGVCHRDVKPENILLSTLPNDALWPTSARLSDFGLAAFFTPDSKLTDIVGTPNYVAPEVVSRDFENNERVGYGPAVDVWAAGILMHWMLTGGKLPFDGADSAAIFRAVRAAKLDLSDAKWNNVSDDAKSLLRGLLHPKAATRLRASAACTHPFLTRAHSMLPITRLTLQMSGRGVRYAGMTEHVRFRAAVRCVMAVNILMGLVRELGVVGETMAVRGERIARQWRGGKQGGRVRRAPERAPVGADGLAYNVGLIPSFAPKRRATVGVSASRRDGGEDGRSFRISRESASSGSRTGSGDRGSLDRSSLGSKNSARSSGWAFRLGARTSQKSQGR